MKAVQREKSVTVPVLTSCSRCGNNHLSLVFEELLRPTVCGYTHWAMCSETQQPLLMKIMSEGAHAALDDNPDTGA